MTGRIAGSGRAISSQDTWLTVGDPAFHLPRQGWKIHLSARPTTLLETVRRMLPAVLATPCHFKIIRSGRRLRSLNSSTTHPGSIGKAVTVYAAPEHVAGLAHRLADDLAGLEGPRIRSDRRVRPDSPVYYRYGPFGSSYAVDENGDLELVVTAPDGTTRQGAADDSYWQPDWAADPLTGEIASNEGTEGNAAPVVVLGGRYQVERGLTRNGKGWVYRAIDTTEDRPVIVKEARAYVDEDSHGRDSRMRLRNERYVLELLREVDGVPRVIDHFCHDDQEYLAITDMGAPPLGRDVGDNGLYTADPAPRGRSLRALATALLELLDEVHQRGVLVRDLNPNNIVLDDATGRPCLVDFEISHAEDPHLYGWTPGYSPPEQERNDLPTAEADYFSLGATLFYAATGLGPTWLVDDPHNHDVPVLRKKCDTLAQHLVPLIEAARSASAKPMHASFCQGLSGIGASLARAARDLGEDGHLTLVRDAALACEDLAPRMYALTQCCGLAGIGEFFLDLTQSTGDRAHLRQAERVADLVLVRAGGTADAPVFPDTTGRESSGGWSTGTAGILSFLRRLRTLTRRACGWIHRPPPTTVRRSGQRRRAGRVAPAGRSDGHRGNAGLPVAERGWSVSGRGCAVALRCRRRGGRRRRDSRFSGTGRRACRGRSPRAGRRVAGRSIRRSAEPRR
ncbi:hypothetical protein GCM10010208_28130 [Actinomadura livida]|nr:hypothetical protein GCM10010208_28130 [Actinomadura livida]